MRKKWTEEHQKFLEKHARFGYDSIKKGLKRNFGEDWAYNTLHNKVSESMLEVGIQKDEVPLIWIKSIVNSATGYQQTDSSLARFAKEEGVARRSPSTGNKLVVPQWWADKMVSLIMKYGYDHVFQYYMRRKTRKLNAEQAKRIYEQKNKKTTKELADEYGVATQTIRDIFNKRSWKQIHAK